MQIDNPYLPPAANLEVAETDAVQAVASGTVVYGGFWRRVGSFWVDAICLSPVFAISFFLGDKYQFQFLWLPASLLINWWFHVYLTSRYGGTPGKLLLKTRIAMLDGSAVTTTAAFVRYSVLFAFSILGTAGLIVALLQIDPAIYESMNYLARNQMLMSFAPGWYMKLTAVSQIWIFSEYLVMMFNKKRRAPQDFMAKTVVIRTNA